MLSNGMIARVVRDALGAGDVVVEDGSSGPSFPSMSYLSEWVHECRAARELGLELPAVADSYAIFCDPRYSELARVLVNSLLAIDEAGAEEREAVDHHQLMEVRAQALGSAVNYSKGTDAGAGDLVRMASSFERYLWSGEASNVLAAAAAREDEAPAPAAEAFPVPIDFGGALRLLRNGQCVRRRGWNGKGMFLYLVAGSTFTVNRAPLNTIYPAGTEVVYRPHIDMRAADGSHIPWLASQADMLASDWEVC